MASFNKVILLGNLTRDPQLKYLPSNTAVCEFGLAVNRRFRDRDGNQREETCFVDVSAFGRAGETINQYMAKGRPILIEGRLKLDTWTGQDGTKRSKLSVIAENFTFVGTREAGGGARAPAPAGAPVAGARNDPGAPEPPVDQELPPEVDAPSGDDIPF